MAFNFQGAGELAASMLEFRKFSCFKPLIFEESSLALLLAS